MAAATADVSVHGFTLMDNHYHLIVTPSADLSLPAMMKQVGEEYVRYFNRKYDRIGTLWTGRYRGLGIGDDKYWLTCLRYVEQNAWRARMVSVPEAYEWCSYRIHAFGEASDWLELHPVYLALGKTPEDRQRAYRAICATPLAEDELTHVRNLRRPKQKCHQLSGV